jgi:serine/threonine protein kinase
MVLLSDLKADCAILQGVPRPAKAARAELPASCGDMEWDDEKKSLGLRRRMLPENSKLLTQFAEHPGPQIVYGVGFTCTIILGHHLDTMQEVAIKVVTKEKLRTPGELERARYEIQIHQQLQHSQIIPVLGAEENSDSFVLITPYTPSGDLYLKTRYTSISEFEARNLASQLVSALAHLHGQHVVMGDFKPHNVLLFEVGGRYVAQLCDFGFAEPLGPNGKVKFTGLRGTTGFFAPELLAEHDYGAAVDMFALGITLYTLIAGYEPFYPVSNFEEVVPFDERYWGHISPECKLLLAQMLCLDPDSRITAAEAVQHPWFGASVKEAQCDACAVRFYHHDELPQRPYG